MDIATLIGLVAAFGLVVYAITLGGSLGSFIDPVSLTIVVGGTIGVILVSYPLSTVLGIIKICLKTFIYKMDAPKDIINQIIEFNQVVRKDGILALESKINDTNNEFLKKGVQMAIDGSEPDDIEEVLYLEVEKTSGRHLQGADIMTQLGTIAPSMGMIGTLVGLVLMLQNMADPASIGPSMAVALLTTFYGALLANLMFLPWAAKLKTRSKDEILLFEIIMAGIKSLQGGENPRITEQKLLGFLPPSQRISSFDK